MLLLLYHTTMLPFIVFYKVRYIVLYCVLFYPELMFSFQANNENIWPCLFTLFLGVPILHVISTPFPDVWHTEDDDASAVHLPTVEKLNMIFRAFVADYLNLPWDLNLFLPQEFNLLIKEMIIFFLLFSFWFMYQCHMS